MTGPNIAPIGPPDGLEPRLPASAPQIPGPEDVRSFRDILEGFSGQVSELQREADQTVVKYNNQEATVDEVMVSFQKAKIAFDALTEIRNKLLDAFEELQRMRI